MKFIVSIALLVVVAAYVISESDACVPHDGACVGDHGTPGDCCSGSNLYCHKNVHTWAQGRCYYDLEGKYNAGGGSSGGSGSGSGGAIQPPTQPDANSSPKFVRGS